jgi:hypothetical protein
MNRRDIFGLCATVAIGFAFLPGSAIAQQAGPTVHRYLSRAVRVAPCNPSRTPLT